MIPVMAAAALQSAPVVPPDFSQLRVFATVERKPSWEDRLRVRIGTFRGMETDPGSDYWFTREIEDGVERVKGRAWSSTASCPAALPVLQQLETLKMPQPDVPGYGRDANIIITDGSRYQLSRTALHADAQAGDYSIESSVQSPLARWADKLMSVLEKCWKPL